MQHGEVRDKDTWLQGVEDEDTLQPFLKPTRGNCVKN